MAQKYILTGGPGVGKTTLTEELRKQGFYSNGEVATYIIEIEMRKNSDILPWKNKDAFQKEVLRTQKDWEKEIPENIETAFLDRGIADGIAYYRIAGMEAPKELMDAAKEAGYEKVFILEPLETYENTKVRREDEETAKKLHTELEKVYRELGYEVVKIPKGTVKERVSRILESILAETEA
jgi:predicted ATPase